jgi:hypothetical protein
MHSESHPPKRAEDIAHPKGISDIKSGVIRTLSDAAKAHGTDTVIFGLIWWGVFHAGANGQNILACGVVGVIATLLWKAINARAKH